MKVERKSDHVVSEDSCKAATGKSLSEWFALMDARGGIALGRRELGQYLFAEMKVDPWWSATINCEYEAARNQLEKDGKARWAVRNDARVTRVGGVIRKLRIDELPQLINVLRGEMSLVGPRPERQCFIDQLQVEIPYYAIRHSVKPGLTGWAQVRYRYDASVDDARRKHQFDLYYVKNHSLLLDLQVLMETVSVVLFGEGAQ